MNHRPPPHSQAIRTYHARPHASENATQLLRHTTRLSLIHCNRCANAALQQSRRTCITNQTRTRKPTTSIHMPVANLKPIANTLVKHPAAERNTQAKPGAKSLPARMRVIENSYTSPATERHMYHTTIHSQTSRFPRRTRNVGAAPEQALETRIMNTSRIIKRQTTALTFAYVLHRIRNANKASCYL